MTLRMTKKRQRVLEVLQQHPGTLSAKDIHAVVPDIDLVTVYRAVDALVSAKLIRKIFLTGAEAQYEYQPEPHHHAVCTDCGRVIHFSIKDDALRQLLPLADFAIEDVELVVKGRCGD